jgi:hypothetical protein
MVYRRWPGFGIAAVDAVAEDRNVGEADVRHHQQFVHRMGQIVEHDLGLVELTRPGNKTSLPSRRLRSVARAPPALAIVRCFLRGVVGADCSARPRLIR